MTFDPKEDNLKRAKKIVAILDELMSDEDWEKTLFLRTIKKRIGGLKQQAENLVTELGGKVETVSSLDTAISAVKPGQTKVYISLYQAKGNNLSVWQSLLKTLSRYSITRPVYTDEDHVREMIRSRPNADSHGYAIVAIKDEDIMHNGATKLDNLGHELLTLKQDSVQLDNLLAFVHANKKTYVWRENQLVLVDTQER